MKKRRLFWITDQVTELHTSKAGVLSERGFAVEFFGDFNSLLKAFSEHRVGVIIVGDEGNPEIVRSTIAKLGTMRDCAGVRLILSISRFDAGVVAAGYHYGFRDILFLDLDDTYWTRRFLFSTAGTAAPYNMPVGRVSMKEAAKVSIPARVIWLTAESIRIETRMKPEVGSSVKLSGKLAEYFGLETIPLTVEQQENFDLKYRFSDASICHMDLPYEYDNKKRLLLDHLKKIDPGEACKVFVVAQSAELRSEILQILTAPRFDVSLALNKKSIVEEPKYFSPHIVFIEDSLCVQENFERFLHMAKNLESNVPIVVVGATPKLDELRSIIPGRQIVPLPKIRPTLTQLIFEKLLTSYAWKRDKDDSFAGYFVPGNNEFSFAEICIDAELTQIHPNVASLQLPTTLGNYGFCQISSPFLDRTLQRKVVGKIVSVTKDGNEISDLPVRCEALLVDLEQDLRRNLSSALLEYLSAQLGKLVKTTLKAPTLPGGGQNNQNYASTVGPPNSDPFKLEIPLFHRTPSVNDPATAQAPSKPVIKPPDVRKVYSSVRPILIFLGVTILAAAAIVFVNSVVAPHYQKHGGNYTEQLKIFQKRP
ncbi:MAG: hypothetical protein AB7T49_16010 [Oligoflexales bacterium]